MTPEQELAEMKRQYEYANLRDYVLVDGILYLRCGVCMKNPVPHNAIRVMWCEPCLDEFEASDESITDFVRRKKAQQ